MSARNTGRGSRDEGKAPTGEIVVIVMLFLAVFGFGVPYLLSERSKAQTAIAQADARSVTMEVESILRELGGWTAGEVRITWNPDTQMLSVPNPGGTPEVIERRLPLTEGTWLLSVSESTQGTNLLVDRRHYCVGVGNGSAQAFQSQNGPIDSCPR